MSAVLPWFAPPSNPPRGDIGIIGAGLAGCFTAYILAARGFKVCLFEREARIASMASGNRQGVIYAKFSAFSNPLTDFYQTSYLYSQAYLATLAKTADLRACYQQCGVLQLASNAKEQRNQQLIFEKIAQHNPRFSQDCVQALSQQAASDVAGLAIAAGSKAFAGLFYPQAGWVAPQMLCEYLTQHPNIRVHTGQHIQNIHYDGQWQLASPNQNWQCAALVLANAHDATAFLQAAYMPLKPLRGQVSHIRAQKEDVLQTVICHRGYIAPAQNGQFVIGASFNVGSDLPHLSLADQRENLAHLKTHVPAAWDLLAADAPLAGKVGFRAHTPDYLPLVGAVADVDFYLKNYRSALQSGRVRHVPQAQYLPHLYVNLGHGARGITSTPFCAQLLADLICNQLPTAQYPIMARLHPARFLVRAIQRQQIQTPS